jgi:hypothetical protein
LLDPYQGGGERGNNKVYPRILDENDNIKGKVLSSPEGSMVIEAISAKGCDVVIKKEDVEKVRFTSSPHHPLKLVYHK